MGNPKIAKLQAPVIGISGVHRGLGVVYTMRGGQCFEREYTLVPDPETPDQLLVRECRRAAKRHWAALSEDDREAWQAYALANAAMTRVGMAGFNYYVKAQGYRLPMGGGLGQAAPATLPPGAVIAIEQSAAPAPDVFAFRVEHTEADVAGKKLLVELTGPMPSLGRKPRVNELRWYRGHWAGSFAELQPSGSGYVLTSARFPVEAGQRYGVRLRIVTDEGVPGPEVMRDFVKAGG